MTRILLIFALLLCVCTPRNTINDDGVLEKNKIPVDDLNVLRAYNKLLEPPIIGNNPGTRICLLVFALPCLDFHEFYI